MEREIELQDSSSAPQGASDDPVHETYPEGMRLVLVTIALVLSIFLSALDSTILATAIPKITSEFHSLADVGWYSSAYAVSNAAFTSSWGKAYRYFPLKRVFFFAVLIFELGNLVCGLAPNSPALITGRVIAGVGGAGIMSGVFIMIAFTAKPKYKALNFAVLGVTFGTSSVIGPLLGGALADGPGWRWCFWVSLPLGLFAVSMTMIFFTPPPSAAPASAPMREKILQLDLLGSVTIMASAICFVLATHWAGVLLPWNSAPVISALTAFACLLFAFVVNEWLMGPKAMVQGHLLRKPEIRANLIYMFFIAGLYFSLLYSLPIQFQAIDSNTATQSGLRLIPLVLGISVFTMVANAVLTFWRIYTPFLVVGGICGTIGAAMIYTLDASASVGTWVAYELLAAIGIGLSLQIPMIANQAAVAIEDISVVTSMTLFFETIGQALFVAAGEAAFTNQLVKSLAEYAPELEAQAVVDVGATQIREVFSSSEIPGIIMSYLEGCQVSHIVSLACGVLASAVSIAMAVPAGNKEWHKWIHKPHLP